LEVATGKLPKMFNDSVSYGCMVLHVGMECLLRLQDIEPKKCTAEGNDIPREWGPVFYQKECPCLFSWLFFVADGYTLSL